MAVRIQKKEANGCDLLFESNIFMKHFLFRKIFSPVSLQSHLFCGVIYLFVHLRLNVYLCGELTFFPIKKTAILLGTVDEYVYATNSTCFECRFFCGAEKT